LDQYLQNLVKEVCHNRLLGFAITPQQVYFMGRYLTALPDSSIILQEKDGRLGCEAMPKPVSLGLRVARWRVQEAAQELKLVWAINTQGVWYEEAMAICSVCFVFDTRTVRTECE
jgi:hypothetical protein